ncbi:MAG: acyltransferase [Candidatus Thorarchaeota archaeon]|jgi:acetyltransferase-like isoleucine patch superfamily enzyme
MTKNNIVVGRDVDIHPTAKILAKEVVIGDFTKIGENVIITGGHVEIGREAWITTNVLIGGGRAEMGSLKTGDFLHLGKGSMVNIANEVTIGNEVGIGMDGRVFTHGAYLSEYDGFPYQEGPVKIGSNVWLPYAIVNPNITIGDNVVVAAMSLVNRDLPSGCLAGGIPVRIISENVYPKPISEKEKIRVVDQVLKESLLKGISAERDSKGVTVTLGKTMFDLPDRRIEGPANENTEMMRDLLRRHGIRFRFYSDGEEYRPWD